MKSIQIYIQKSQFSSVQSLSYVWFFVTPWTAAHQASLSITNSHSLLRLMSIESVMPSYHLILCHPLFLQSFPASGSFPMNQFFTSGGQSIGASASASVLPMNIQDWFPLGCTGTSCEIPGWMKHKLESRLLLERSITSNTQMTPPLWQKVKKN